MQPEVFALSSNAFCVLRASYTSTASEIAELMDEAQFEGTVSESDLHKAQQALVIPRLRLAAELGWLPELSQAQIEKIFDRRLTLSSGALLSSVEMLPELARANLIADLCGRQATDVDAVNALMASWDTLDNSSLFDFIGSGRKVSGFPSPDWKSFLIALQHLKERHAATATASLLRSPTPQDAVRRLVDGNSSDGSPSSFLSLIVKEYENRNEATLSRITDEIGEAVEAGNSQPKQIQSSVAKIHKLLLEWMDLLGPVSPSYVSRGLTEPRSKALFQKCRAFSLHLANDEARYEDARKIALALLTCFIPYQELTKVAEKDLNDLDDLIKEQRDLELFQPLYSACDEAKSHYFEFSKTLKAQGLNAGSSAPVGALVRATNNFIAGNGNPNVGVNVLRDLALTCNNDHGDPEASYLLTQFVLERFRTLVDDGVVETLEEDAGTVFKNWKISDLEKNSKNLSWMIQQLQGIVAVAPSTVRREFSNMLDALIEARRKKRIKWAWIAGIAAIIIVPAIISENKTSTPRSSYTSSNTTTTRTTSYSPSVDDYQESVPPIGTGLTLSKPQVRYCTFQGRRLDLLRSMAATSSAVFKFNVLIEDYNSRCSSFRYWGSDLTSVEAEASGRTAQFQQEAANLSRNW
ncbi:hypothetical protein [Sinorhizobium meliloti]|uniref:hypothetical protein n=1 Tax=Rhizobium meliloti TaxID=382 RepID=UPI000FDC3BCA|nr:hypothetical protein [Sinorhizobium meliloti]RVK25459.1 hypothetical protein CN163_33075 [Sinorhizobium meliloti]